MMVTLKRICFLLFCSAPLYGTEVSSFYQSSRSLGRGGTYVAARDSDEASFLNPATIAEAPLSYQMRILQFDNMMSTSALQTIFNITQMLTMTSTGSDFLKNFEDKFGKRQYFHSQLLPVGQRFSTIDVTPFTIMDAWLEISQPDLPRLSWSFDTVWGVNFADAYGVGNNLFVSYRLRPLYRIYLKNQYQYQYRIRQYRPNLTKLIFPFL